MHASSAGWGCALAPEVCEKGADVWLEKRMAWGKGGPLLCCRCYRRNQKRKQGKTRAAPIDAKLVQVLQK